MQVPVMSAEVSGIPEPVEHMASRIPGQEKNSEALAEAIALLLSRLDLSKRFGERGRAKVLNHSTLQDNVRIQRLSRCAGKSRTAAVREQGKTITHEANR